MHLPARQERRSYSYSSRATATVGTAAALGGYAGSLAAGLALTPAVCSVWIHVDIGPFEHYVGS
jgi:hypothetical protein